MQDDNVYRYMKQQGYYRIALVKFHKGGKQYYYRCRGAEEIHSDDYLVVEIGDKDKYVSVCAVFWTKPEDIDYSVENMKFYKRLVTDEDEKTKAFSFSQR